MDATIGQPVDRAPKVDPQARNAELANARRTAGENALANAEAAQARKADQREMTRAIIERAVGANTRLSIARNDMADTYIYRAVDRDTGEVIKEWPPVQFAQFLQENGAGEISRADLQGLLVNEQV